jgi:hypothetical protein
MSAPSHELPEDFFINIPKPKMSEFGFASTCLTVHLTELAHAIFFDDRGRTRTDVNYLVLLNAQYSEDSLLSQLISSSINVFLSSLRQNSDTGSREASNNFDSSKFMNDEDEVDEMFLMRFEEKEDTFDDSNIPSFSLANAGTGSVLERRVRRSIIERKTLALSSLDNLIDFWRQLLQYCGSSATTFERNLRSTLSDDTHDYDPYVCRRKLCLMMLKQLTPLWLNKSLYSLPYHAVRSILDLLYIAIKTSQDMKGFPVQSMTSTSAQIGQLQIGNSISPSLLPTLNVVSSRIGQLRERNRERSEHRREFRPDETALNTLVSMGFGRDTVTNAMNTLRTNSISAITEHLLAVSGSGAATNETLSNRIRASRTSDPSSTHAALVSSQHSLSELPRPVESIEQNADTPSANDPGTIISLIPILVVNIFCTDVQIKFNGVLPLIPKKVADELKKEKMYNVLLLRFIYCLIPKVGLCLIENSVGGKSFQWDPVSAILNQGYTRENATVMVLQFMIKCLERYSSWPESGLRLVQLAWFHKRAIEILTEGVYSTDIDLNVTSEIPPLNQERCSRLYGLLHAILLLFHNKINPSNQTRNSGTTPFEICFIVFSCDERYSRLYNLLAKQLEYVSEHENLSQFFDSSDENANAASNFSLMTSEIDSRLQWIAPAVLLLDTMAQSILIDVNGLEGTINTFRKSKFDDVGFLADIKKKGFHDTIITDESFKTIDQYYLSRLKKQITSNEDNHDEEKSASTSHVRFQSRDKFSLSTNPLRSKRKRSIDQTDDDKPHEEIQESLPLTSSSASQADEQFLPLSNDGLSLETKLTCVEFSLKMIKQLNLAAKKIEKLPEERQTLSNFCNSLVHAILQLLVHVTRSSESRDRFQKLNGANDVLNLLTKFDGMQTMVFTLLQHQLEDDQYLQTTMETTIRLCLSRLVNDSNGVPYRVMIEALTPLIYRNQRIFLKALKSMVKIVRCGPHTFVRLKENKSYVQPVLDSKGESQQKTSTTSDEKQPEAVEGNVEVNDSSATKRLKTAHETSTVADTMVVSEEHAPLADSITSVLNVVADSALHSHAGEKRNDKKDAKETGKSQPLVRMTTPNNGIGGKRSLSKTTSLKFQRSNSFSSNSSQDDHRKLSQSQLIVEDLLGRIVLKWHRAKSISSMNMATDPDILFDKVLESSLSVSELLLTTADLVSSVSGLIGFIHRYNVVKFINRTSFNINTSSELFQLRHCMTNQPLITTSFITFLIHHIIVSPDDDAGDTSGAEKSKEKPNKPESKLDELVRKMNGENLHQNGSYLLSALVSRPGEGRRRILIELLNTLKMDVASFSFASDHQLNCVKAISDVIFNLINPPVSWSSRNTFVIPSRDILNTLEQLNAIRILSDAMCMLSLESARCNDALQKLSAPLEMLIRKGSVVTRKLKKEPFNSGRTLEAHSESYKSTDAAAEPLSTPLPQSRETILGESSISFLTSDLPNDVSRDSPLTPERVNPISTAETPNENEFSRLSVPDTDHVHLMASEEQPSQHMVESSDEDVDGDEEDDEEDDEDEDDENNEDVSYCIMLSLSKLAELPNI